MTENKNFLTPLLPLSSDSGELEYKHTGDYSRLIRQNLKNLVLTIPGERMMDTNFGVGIQRYLFETSTPFAASEISSEVALKLKMYMPFVKLTNVSVEPGEAQGSLVVGIFYSVPTLAIEEYLDISFTDDGKIIS